MAGSRVSGRGMRGGRRAAGGRGTRGRRLRWRRLLAFAALVLLALAALPPRPAHASPAGMAEDLDAYLDEAFSASDIPGMAVAVVDADGTDYLRTFGDVASSDETFVVGSLSKSMTALAIQQLVDGGLIDLDAPAADYAPGYDVPPTVTVRMLLNQTSGFGYYESLARARVGESLDEFSYANANYDLLGRIVESVSGMSYASYLRSNVFDAAGMTDASVDGVSEPAAPAAPAHRNWFGHAVQDGFEHAENDDEWGGQASGYVRASIRDMASYLRLYLNDGGGVASSEAVARMVWNRVPNPAGDTFYGMGWTTYADGGGSLVMSHDGDVENYVARMVVVPEDNVAVVLMADENDVLGGNAAFWDIGDGVLSIARGFGAETGMVADDAADARETHAKLDAAYALALAAAAMPLVLSRRWTRRMTHADAFERVARGGWALMLHVGVPALVAWLPTTSGMRLRDFAAFYPEQAVVGLSCIALLVFGGVTKLVRVLRATDR